MSFYRTADRPSLCCRVTPSPSSKTVQEPNVPKRTVWNQGMSPKQFLQALPLQLVPVQTLGSPSQVSAGRPSGFCPRQLRSGLCGAIQGTVSPGRRPQGTHGAPSVAAVLSWAPCASSSLRPPQTCVPVPVSQPQTQAPWISVSLTQNSSGIRDHLTPGPVPLTLRATF